MKRNFGWVLGSLFCAGLLIVSTAIGLAEEEGYTSLFNGNDIDGWVKYGGEATYATEDGCIVGKRGDGPNTFLCTPKSYNNFILKFECKFDLPINSGVQFRSNVRKEGDHNVVFGYQCEMDQNTGCSGCIYDESRRNRWVSNINPEETSKAFKKDEWNEFVVQCVGPSSKIWVNGVLCSDMYDVVEMNGFIGLQVHGSNEDGQVRWRNIRIKELPVTEWKSLFQPNFDGLWVSPAGKWEMIVLATSGNTENRDGMIKSKESYKDFAARVTFKQGNGNSGLYFRATEVEKPYWLKGFQNEIDANATGGLWEVEGRGWVAQNTEMVAKVFKKDDWNELVIVAIGDRLVTVLNGQVIVDIIDPLCAKEGKLALQMHGGNDMNYQFKNFEVLPLTQEQRDMIENNN